MEIKYRKEAEAKIDDSTPDSKEFLARRQVWEKSVEELSDYTIKHPEQAKLIKDIDDLILLDNVYTEARMTGGGSNEVREWERKSFPEKIKLLREEILKLNIGDEQIDMLLNLIFLSNSELFKEGIRTYSQNKLDEKYIEVLKGDNSFYKGLSDLLKGYKKI